MPSLPVARLLALAVLRRRSWSRGPAAPVAPSPPRPREPRRLRDPGPRPVGRRAARSSAYHLGDPDQPRRRDRRAVRDDARQRARHPPGPARPGRRPDRRRPRPVGGAGLQPRRPGRRHAAATPAASTSTATSPTGGPTSTAATSRAAGPASEPETRAIMRFLRDVDPDWLLSFHQPLNGVDTDTKRPAFARRVARELHLPRRTLDCGGVATAP